MKQIKVLHGFVNYGTQAGFLARGLREQGVKALSVANHDQFDRFIDVEFLHGGNIFQRVLKHSYNSARKFYWFFKYNTFHFYYGNTLFPWQIDLPFYRLFGKKVVFHYLGNDVQGYKKSVEKYKWTNITAYIDKNDSLRHDLNIEKRVAFESKYADLKFVCAPCYSEFVPNALVLPLAIDLKDFEYSDLPMNDILEIMHAPTHRGNKGTDFIIKAIEKLISEGAPISFNLVENVTHDRLKEEYKKVDIFIDQILGGWYGTASIEAMALGRPVICSIRKSYFEYIDYGPEIPIIHADPDCIYDSIKYLINNRSKLPEIGKASRRFVEKVHDVRNITTELIKYYQNLS
jgi:glycosyltransferase involved in cell wall biosynthesis